MAALEVGAIVLHMACAWRAAGMPQGPPESTQRPGHVARPRCSGMLMLVLTLSLSLSLILMLMLMLMRMLMLMLMHVRQHQHH